MFFIIVGSTTMFAGEMKEQDFYLQIKLIDYEKSKDSNSQHYSIVVKNREVTYHYEYNGFPFPSDREKSSKYRLSDTQFKEMIEQIRSNNIDKNVTELKKDKYIGHFVDLSLTLKINGKITQSHITGMTSSFRHKDKLISHKLYVDNVESLISDLRKAKKVIKIPKIK